MPDFKPQTPRPYRPAESLLDSIGAESLDPSYAAAARRRAVGGPVRWWTRVLGVVGFVMAGLILGISAQQAEARRLPAAEERQALSREIVRKAARVDSAGAELRALRAEVAERRAAALLRNGGDNTLSRLADAQVAAATVPVRGPGIVIRIDDAAGTDDAVSLDPREQEAADAGRVLDRDLQAVVNGLWASGAEAVSVGEHRLSSLSAIRAAGLAILVDYNYVLPPYEIRAIGDPAALGRALESGPVGHQLRSLRDDAGIQFSVEFSDRLHIPAAEPAQLRWAVSSALTEVSPATDPSRQGGIP